MRTLARAVALLAFFPAVTLGAAPPPPEPLPLSCLPAAKPFFARAWEAFSNVHHDEARELFDQTVAVDPSCALAWAYAGSLTPGAQGRTQLTHARETSGAASEVERLLVQSLEAQHAGDLEAALTLARKARDLQPQVYELNFIVAQRAGVLQQWPETKLAAQRATDLAPDRGAGWNLLGYANVGLGQHAAAVKAFQRYAKASPGEPNAHDSLGDALLADDRLDEARLAYQRALDASEGNFWVSGHGVATVSALQGDWFSARAAIEKARRSAPQLDDRLKLMQWTAWSYLASNEPSEALTALDDAEADARRAKLELRAAEAMLLKGQFQLLLGRDADALKTFTAAGGKKTPTLNDGQRLGLETARLQGLAESQAKLGRIAAAEKSVTQLRSVVEARPNNLTGQAAIAHARGVIALAKKDPRLAASAFGECAEASDTCRLDLSLAQDAAGDPILGAATRASILRLNHRAPDYWWVRVRAAVGNTARATPTNAEERPSY